MLVEVDLTTKLSFQISKFAQASKIKMENKDYTVEGIWLLLIKLILYSFLMLRNYVRSDLLNRRTINVM